MCVRNVKPNAKPYTLNPVFLSGEAGEEWVGSPRLASVEDSDLMVSGCRTLKSLQCFLLLTLG